MTQFVKDIKLKADGAGKTANDINKVGTASKKTEKNVGSMIKKFAGFAAVAVILKKVAKELAAMTREAIDAQETTSKFGTVFRDVSKDAENFAKNLADSFGLAKVEAKGLLADTGDLLTGFGFTQESALDLSNEVQKLAVDLASFTNFSGGAEGASKALTKALLGERESVKSLGISILEEDVKAKMYLQSQEGMIFATERQAKAYATLTIAQEQSQNAIGDFARTSDQTANRIRIAEAAIKGWRVEMGSNFTPLVNKGASAVTEFFKRATETSLETTIRQLKDMGAEMGDISELVLINNLLKADDALEESGNQFDKLAKKASKLSEAISKNEDNEWEIDTKKARGDVDALTKQATEYGKISSDNRLKVKEFEKEYEDASYARRIVLAKEISALNIEADAYDQLVPKRNKDRVAILKTMLASENLTKQTKAYGKALDDYYNKSTQSKQALLEQTTVANLLEKGIDDLGKKYKWTAEQADDFKKSLGELTKEMQAGGVSDISLRLQADDTLFSAKLKALKTAFDSGEMSKLQYTALVAQVTEEQINESILQPLQEIPVVEGPVVNLQTDAQKFIDGHSQMFDDINSIASDASNVYDNIIEGRFQSELQLMKDGLEYKKADVDKRSKMEQDLNSKYKDQRIAAFRFQQAADSASVAISTIKNSIEIGVAQPWLLAATLGAGIAAEAAIWSQPVPAYAEGGMLPYSGSAQMFVANENEQEAVITGTGIDVVGGAIGIDELNSGQVPQKILNEYYNIIGDSKNINSDYRNIIGYETGGIFNEYYDNINRYETGGMVNNDYKNIVGYETGGIINEHNSVYNPQKNIDEYIKNINSYESGGIVNDYYSSDYSRTANNSNSAQTNNSPIFNLNIEGDLIVDSDERVNQIADRMEYLSKKGHNEIATK